MMKRSLQIKEADIDAFRTRLKRDFRLAASNTSKADKVKSLEHRITLAIKAVEANISNPELSAVLWDTLLAPRYKELRCIIASTDDEEYKPLTAAHVRMLRKRIEADLTTVPNTSEYYQRISSRVQMLGPILESIASDIDAQVDPQPEWSDIIGSQFEELTYLFTEALNLDPDNDTGACLYLVNNNVDCIFCTDTQCLDLGGVFEAGEDCPPE
jgi:hypothetical protein